ncbi:ATP-binding protein [Acetobacterium woodii]|uniref:Mg-protoporphyrin IX chelatase n=1 Tax=Acetobacterium woodii (strain ATCC 29683 / DSM 1030 / JCM 2381 / KCTC 1655 / WB1) TaxID=931626 RepID=H6LCN8_ACEWD|nr:ATP-binding protein [Acetobacterium woodii]AFA47820.1 magnesium chelatase 38 kDa subunit ChlI [Acetobacterium woodii DSM 1030]
MKKNIKIYPFTAIVGQEKMKLALILNVINPSLGGVLIRGEKGTAKSTAVRALADLLPERNQIEACKFSCDPLNKDQACAECLEKIKTKKINTIQAKMKVIDLPVSATEDRVVGTLDIEHAIKKGEKRFEPGILAQANRNILYVDEVNLLDDHVVDILLDSAAMGVNTIEREGISFTHPAKFTLVGTMNPEEGDLRPQLLDRFGLVVDVIGEGDISQRVEVIKRRLDFEKESDSFHQEFNQEQTTLADTILKAIEFLPDVTFDEQLLEIIAKISTALGVDGHRADIVMMKTAMTIAAYHGRAEVTKEDVKEAAGYVLPHRMRKRPFDDSQFNRGSIEEIVNELVG